MIQLLKRMRRREALMALLCAVLVVGQVYFDLRLPDYMTELTKLIKTPGSNDGRYPVRRRRNAAVHAVQRRARRRRAGICPRGRLRASASPCAATCSTT